MRARKRQIARLDQQRVKVAAERRPGAAGRARLDGRQRRERPLAKPRLRQRFVEQGREIEILAGFRAAWRGRRTRFDQQALEGEMVMAA